MSESAKRRVEEGRGSHGNTSGRSLSEEHKARIGSAMRRRPVTWGDKISAGKKGRSNWTAEHRANFMVAKAKVVIVRGASHGNYRGVLNYLSSASSVLREWRQRVFARDNWTCQMCGVRGGIELNADHVIPKWADLRLAFTVANGRTLCRACHVDTETFGPKAPRRPKQYQIPLPIVV